MRMRSTSLVVVIFAGGLSAGGCGGGGPGAAVASLSSHTSTTKAAKSAPDAKKSFEDGMLAYSRCMRQHGVDIPDPKFESNGTGGAVAIQAGPSGGNSVGPDKNSAAFAAAHAACKPILDT